MLKHKTHNDTPLYKYSQEEIKTMLIKEGVPESEASDRAILIRRIINRFSRREKLSWKRKYKHEIALSKLTERHHRAVYDMLYGSINKEVK